MRILSRLALAAAIFGGGLSPVLAQTAGDWVLARYKGGDYWFPGIVQSIAGDRVVVAYDDGDRETLALSRVRPYNWAIGSRVECNFKRGGKWYPGVISSLAGEALGVNYDDGDKERTKTGLCRSS